MESHVRNGDKMKRKHGGTVYATINVIRDFEDMEVKFRVITSRE